MAARPRNRVEEPPHAAPRQRRARKSPDLASDVASPSDDSAALSARAERLLRLFDTRGLLTQYLDLVDLSGLRAEAAADIVVVLAWLIDGAPITKTPNGQSVSLPLPEWAWDAERECFRF
jgi:hypothetical protein